MSLFRNWKAGQGEGFETAYMEGLNPTRRIMMSMKSWMKWSLLLAGSSVATFALGNCIAEALLQTFILRAVN